LHKRVEKLADRRKVKFLRRLGCRPAIGRRQSADVVADVAWRDAGKLKPLGFAPPQEAVNGVAIGPAGIIAGDLVAEFGEMGVSSGLRYGGRSPDPIPADLR
jgi:hypothetical protein